MLALLVGSSLVLRPEMKVAEGIAAPHVEQIIQKRCR